MLANAHWHIRPSPKICGPAPMYGDSKEILYVKRERHVLWLFIGQLVRVNHGVRPF